MDHNTANNMTTTTAEDDHVLAQQYRYALHTAGSADDFQNASHISNDTPVPNSLHPVLNRNTNSGGGIWYPLPGMPVPTWATLKIWTQQWFYTSAWPGMGLFGESYLLFSTGILRPIWETLFPECFSYETCSPKLLHSLTYGVVLGVITGMIVFGHLAKYIGRRKGSIGTASLMSGGAIGLWLATYIPSDVWLYRSMAFLLFIFGVGVGGEYPLSASLATEKSMQEHLHDKDDHGRNAFINKEDLSTISEIPRSVPSISNNNNNNNKNTIPRGRQVQMVFTMQGVGIWCNALVMTFLLLVMGQTSGNYNNRKLLIIWRITYVLGAAILLAVLVARKQYLKESLAWADDKHRRETAEYNNPSDPAGAVAAGRTAMTVPQLQPPSVDLELPETSPAAVAASSSSHLPSDLSNVSSLSNPTVAVDPLDEMRNALHGSSETAENDDEDNKKRGPFGLLMHYYGMRLFGASASWLLWDVAFYGNKLFQSAFLLALTGQNEWTLFQFALAATLNATVALVGYVAAGYLLDHPSVGRIRLQAGGFVMTGLLFIICGFSIDKLPTFWVVLFYLASSLFGQAPNATTYIIPAEAFPTEMRTLTHGMAAASGKVGALIAAFAFNYISDGLHFFLFCGYASLLGAIVTIWTIPESTGLDVVELDQLWRMTLTGNRREYRGPANHPRHRSMYEHWQSSRRQEVFNTGVNFQDLS